MLVNVILRWYNQPKNVKPPTLWQILDLLQIKNFLALESFFGKLHFFLSRFKKIIFPFRQNILGIHLCLAHFFSFYLQTYLLVFYPNLLLQDKSSAPRCKRNIRQPQMVTDQHYLLINDTKANMWFVNSSHYDQNAKKKWKQPIAFKVTNACVLW